MPDLPTPALHEWNLMPEAAIALQKRLAPKIQREDRLGEVSTIAGMDIGFEDGGEITRAALILLEWPSLTLVEQIVHREPTRMPYVPGLLSFREIPAALGAFSRLSRWPDLIMIDGQGIAHPRRLGIASHLGLWLDLPTIGVGKSRLCGRFGDVPEEKGHWTPLTDRRRPEDPADIGIVEGDRVTIGAVLRSRENVKPLFISGGHRVSLETAVDWVTACLGKTKLPEPTRLADRLASRRGEVRESGRLPL
ncbi:deoxyribonuclease V [Salinicola rhizosphaerae]|uniref:Endonuclease V n=1 Tax=Salinicola rhizosphaerae TaxID=1443141 RepID=A0ABQ3E6A7_9GAMM|nr:deoxyribonuclease V [Salinicola rhizosphaerae]GHB23888.1 endonuclease V [Salinicola rhizosphaerae]